MAKACRGGWDPSEEDEEDTGYSFEQEGHSFVASRGQNAYNVSSLKIRDPKGIWGIK